MDGYNIKIGYELNKRLEELRKSFNSLLEKPISKTELINAILLESLDTINREEGYDAKRNISEED